jgi:hypothetical protein
VSKFLALILTSLSLLAGCGGSGTSTHQPPPPPPPPPNQVIATPGPPNAEKLVIDEGPTSLQAPAVNTAFITVNVCMPDGTFATCQAIDHIEIDTGSIGLRIIAKNGPFGSNSGMLSLALPPVPDPNNAANVLAECLEFADGFSWGSVNRADISLPVSGETATNVIVHVIGATSAGDPAKASPTCVPPAPLVTENTVPAFGANGILGVGPFVNDCNSTSDCRALAPSPPGCSGSSCYPGNSATYFSCTAAASCAQTTVHLQQQLPNPAVVFAKHADGSVDNNGVIVELPAVGASGAMEPFNGGVLVFGIGTQSNNAIAGATKLPADQSSGVISATLNGNTYKNSYLDSGSNANFFPSTLPGCPSPNQGFLCPGSTTSESATLQGTDGMVLAADFSVANANSLFSPSVCTPHCLVAFSNLAGNNSDNTSVDLGLSFFFGRNVFTGFEDPNVSAPYFAY